MRRLSARAARLVLAASLVLAACGTRVDDSTSSAGVSSAGTPTGAGGAAATGPVAGPGAQSSDTAVAGGAQSPSAGATGAASSSAASAVSSAANGAGAASGVPRGGPPIVIGAVGTRTGVVGAQGAGAWTGLTAWEQDVNARGGINGRQVKLIIADDGGDPGQNAAAVRQLIDDDHVVAFVGSYAPVSFSGGLPAIEQAGIPAMGGDSAEKGWFTSPNAFPFNGEALPQGKALAEYGCAHLAQKKLAIYYVQEIAFGKIIADVIDQNWRACGRTTVAKTGISLAQPDFTNEVLQAKSKGADVVAILTDISGCGRFWEAAQRQSYKPAWFTAVSCFNGGAANFKSEVVNNIYAGITSELPTGDAPGIVAMRAAVTRFYPGFSGFTDGELPLGWGAGLMFEAVLAGSGGKTDGASLLASLRSFKHVTLGGLFAGLTFGPGPHSEQPCAKIATYDGARWSSATPNFLC